MYETGTNSGIRTGYNAMYHQFPSPSYPSPALAGRPTCPWGTPGCGGFPIAGVELSPGVELGVGGI